MHKFLLQISTCTQIMLTKCCNWWKTNAINASIIPLVSFGQNSKTNCFNLKWKIRNKTLKVKSIFCLPTRDHTLCFWRISIDDLIQICKSIGKKVKYSGKTEQIQWYDYHISAWWLSWLNVYDIHVTLKVHVTECLSNEKVKGKASCPY